MGAYVALSGTARYSVRRDIQPHRICQPIALDVAAAEIEGDDMCSIAVEANAEDVEIEVPSTPFDVALQEVQPVLPPERNFGRAWEILPQAA